MSRTHSVRHSASSFKLHRHEPCTHWNSLPSVSVAIRLNVRTTCSDWACGQRISNRMWSRGCWLYTVAGWIFVCVYAIFHHFLCFPRTHQCLPTSSVIWAKLAFREILTGFPLASWYRERRFFFTEKSDIPREKRMHSIRTICHASKRNKHQF